MLPAWNTGSHIKREMAICASGTGRHRALQDAKGTCDFLEYMDRYEFDLKERLGADYVPEADWKTRWYDIICGSNNVGYKFCWTHEQCGPISKLRPFTKRWWEEVPTPIRVKVTRGHSGPMLDDDARGKPLPESFVTVLYHYGYLANAPTIAKEGLKPGKLCGMSSKNCVHFSVDIFNPTLYQEAQERLAKGDLELPARVGYPPRYDYNAEFISN